VNNNRRETEMELGTFEGRDIVQTSVAVTNAGDGLSQSLTVEPRILHVGDTGAVVLEYTVTKVGFVPVKDTDVLARVATLKAGNATLIDLDVVGSALEANRVRIEQARGLFRLDLDGDEGDGE
jgi:hypothetical protein